MRLVTSVPVLALFGLIIPTVPAQPAVSGGSNSKSTSGTITATTPIAVTTSGPLTVQDLIIYSSVVKWPYQNPLEVLARAPRADIRADASDFMTRSVREILHHRHYGDQARSEGLVLNREEKEYVDTLQDNCVDFTENEFIRERITIVSQADYARLSPELIPQYLAPEQREVIYIFQEVKEGSPGRSDAEVKATMQKVRGEISAGSLKVTDAATRYSEAESASKAGRIGLVRRDSGYSPRFIDLVFSTPDRTLSAVTRLGRGYYLVYVDGVVPERTIESQDAEIRSQILRTLREEEYQRTVSEALKRYPSVRSPQQALARLQEAEKRQDPICVDLRKTASDLALSQRYNQKISQATLRPSEAEMRKYYEENPILGKLDGFWRLTRVRVLAGAGQPYPNTAKADEVARQLRDAVVAGTLPKDLAAQFPRLKLEVDSTSDWIRSTDNGPADRELNKLPVGGVTSVILQPNEAMFFRKDEQREVPVRPFEQMKDRIADVLMADRVGEMLKQDRERLYKTYKVREVWQDMLPADIRAEIAPLIEARSTKP